LRGADVVTEPKSVVRASFDRIALVAPDGWNHNEHYHGFLLRHVPETCRAALDIGCGTGAFSRLLAARSERVVALDLSPRMIEIARARSKSYPNIWFQVIDVTEWPFPEEAFDSIVSIATMHHLPMEGMLLRMKQALRVGGILAILDLYESSGWQDRLSGIVATPVGLALSLVKTGRLREPRRAREAWAAHGRTDRYPTLTEVREICRRMLPGARVRKHLLWRYSVIWEKAT